jgi:CheY-like chemotaxis protein
MQKQILIVEDHPDHRRILVLRLRSVDCKIIEASNGEDGIKKALEEQPDLILMDLALPGMDGFEAALRLKQDPKTAHIPIVAYTVLGKGVKAKVLAAGMADLFDKSDAVDNLLKIVRRLLYGAE